MSSNGRSKRDTTATLVAQSVLEQISLGVGQGLATVPITDCQNNVVNASTAQRRIRRTFCIAAKTSRRWEARTMPRCSSASTRTWMEESVSKWPEGKPMAKVRGVAQDSRLGNGQCQANSDGSRLYV